MNTQRFDYVVIGGGSAGYNAAATAARLGLKTVVIEGGEEVGGLCILRGCMPSKTLLESGHRAEAIREAGKFGLKAEYLGADGGEIRARKRHLIGEFAGYRQQQLESGKFAFIRGHASFLDSHSVEVRLLNGETERIEAAAFLIATGSRLNWVNIPGLREAGVMSSDDVLESDKTPRSVVVLGGGPTALEFASYFAGIGAEVTIVQRSAQLIKETDADIAQSLTQALEKRGIRIFVETKLLDVETDGSLKRVRFEHAGKEMAIDAEEIVYALGRRPNTEGLELSRAGVETNRAGAIVANDFQQTAVPHIFTAGDVTGPYEIVHIAIQQADLATRNAARLISGSTEPLEGIDYSLKLFAIFTHPQLAAAGLSAREAKEQGIDVVEASYRFDDHGKSMVRGETDGFVKLIARRDTRKIIGAAAVGPEVSEIIHEIVVAMAFGATAGQLARIPHYHPTLSEIWTYPAEELAEA